MVVSYFLVNPHVLLNDSLAPSTVRAQRAHKRLLACVRAKVLPQTAKRRMGRGQLHMMEAHVRDATQIKKSTSSGHNMLTVNADSARLMVTITVKANDGKSSPELSYQIARNNTTHSTEVIQTK
jgi:hypothetical protein